MGILDGIRVIELAGMGPGPFAGMMLADHGAEVIRVARTDAHDPLEADPARSIVNRSRRLVSIDLKHPDGVATLRRLVRDADALIEGFRPGVMERLGLGPDDLLKENPKLVYGRMTGWGQEGPLAQTAGHDIDYIAISGALHTFGRAGEKPLPPLNIIGDIGGGGLLLAFGIVGGVLAAQRTGVGQVVDCAMVDGAALMSAMTWMLLAQGRWRDERGVNLLDTGAHFYETYECADGKFLAVGAIEPQFYAEFRRLTGLDSDADLDAQWDVSRWPAFKEKIAEKLKSRSRDEWWAVFAGTDACVAPILALGEVAGDPHIAARGTLVKAGGVTQPAPAPRFSNSGTIAPAMPAADNRDTAEVLASAGFTTKEISALAAAGTISVAL